MFSDASHMRTCLNKSFRITPTLHPTLRKAPILRLAYVCLLYSCESVHNMSALCRWVKSDAELGLMQGSASTAAAALRECMTLTHPGVQEHHLAATFGKLHKVFPKCITMFDCVVQHECKHIAMSCSSTSADGVLLRCA